MFSELDGVVCMLDGYDVSCRSWVVGMKSNLQLEMVGKGSESESESECEVARPLLGMPLRMYIDRGLSGILRMGA